MATASPFDAAVRDVLDGLQAAGRDLLRAENPAEVAQLAAAAALRITASDCAVVALGRAERGYDQVFTRTADRARPLTDGATSDLLAAAGFGHGRTPAEREWAAIAGAELRAHGRTLGAAVVTRPADYTQTERLALDILATYAGLAAAASMRWDEQARGVERVERAHEQAVEVLTAVSSHAATGEDLTGFYDQLARTVGELVGAERVLFWRLRSDGMIAPIPGGFHVDGEFLSRLKPARCEPGRDDLASRVVFDDLIFRASRTDHPPQHAYVLEILGVESAISVPWRAGEERLGILAAYDSTRPGGFSREDAWVLQKAGLAAGLVTRLWHSQEELRKTVDRLTKVDGARQLLLKNMTSVAEKERKRFVTDLHDDALQKLSAAELQLGRLEPGAEVDGSTLERLKDLLEQTESALRHVVFDVRPPALEAPDGLAQSIRDRAMMLEGAGITTELEIDVAEELPVETRALIFRQVAEAIGNAERHSHATQLNVSLSTVDGGILGVVRDNGQGFVVAERSHLPGHMGLLALRERALMAGGRYRIESTPGAGTHVEFWIPLES